MLFIIFKGLDQSGDPVDVKVGGDGTRVKKGKETTILSFCILNLGSQSAAGKFSMEPNIDPTYFTVLYMKAGLTKK